MSVLQTIQNVTDKIQNGNLADLRQGLKTVSQLSKSQLLANETTIAYPVQQMTQAIQRNIKLNQAQITPDMQIRGLIKNAAQNLPVKIKKQVGSTINDLQRQTTRKGEQNAIDKMVNKQARKIEQQIIKQAVEAKDVTNINIQPIEQKISSTKTPIQLSIQQFQPILNNVNIPKITKPSDLPPTMQLLSKYAQLKGAGSIGSVTNQMGVSYVGLRSIDRGNGVTEIVPFQKNQIFHSNVPSIPMQLQYYANKTINSWNKYINNQSQFVNFISKVNTQNDRKQYVEKQFRNLNGQTFAAQMMATISHYYLYLPLQKMAGKININSMVAPSQAGFLTSYQLGNTPQSNPLMLGISQGRSVARAMLNSIPKKPTLFFNETMSIIDTFKSGLNQKAIVELKSSPQMRLQQATSFMQQNGLTDVLIAAVLLSNDWSSIKRKKFLIAQGIVNAQITQMATKIVQQQTIKTDIKLLSFKWGSSDIVSHDYLWQWSSRYN